MNRAQLLQRGLLAAGLLLSACTEKETPANNQPPPFNYIPLNDEACEIQKASPALAQNAEKTFTDILKGSNNLVAEGLEICSPLQKNGTPTCDYDDNPMAGLIRDMDAAVKAFVSEQTSYIDLSDGLIDYFRRALLYPYRSLVVSSSDCATLADGSCAATTGDGTQVRVTLTQGKRQPCAPGVTECHHFSIEPESLDKSCSHVQMTFFGRETAAGANKNTSVELYGDAKDDVTFGFAVPLTNDLPKNPENLTDAEINTYLETLKNLENRMDVRVTDPVVTTEVAADGTGYGRLTGYVHRKIFEDYIKKATPGLSDAFSSTILPQYLDSVKKDYIRATISFRLEKATFVSGIACKPDPCSGPRDVTCDGDQLKMNVSMDVCTLPAPAGYTTGTAIAHVCEAKPAVPWTIDCGALGATCEQNECTEDWTVPQPGQLVISEIQASTSSRAFWAEVTNATQRPLLLTDCVLSSMPVEFGERQTLRTPAPLVLGPGQRIVFAESNTEKPRPEANIEFSTSMDFDMNDDIFRVFCGGQLIDSVTWKSPEWAFPELTSLQLDPTKMAADQNDSPSAWCVSNDSGTPGAANTSCAD